MPDQGCWIVEVLDDRGSTNIHANSVCAQPVQYLFHVCVFLHSSEEPPTISKETEPRTTPKKKKVLMINTHFHTLNIYKSFLSIKEKKSKKKK